MPVLGSVRRAWQRTGQLAGPCSYFTPGASAPRQRLRQPYPRRRRVAVVAPAPAPSAVPVAAIVRARRLRHRRHFLEVEEPRPERRQVLRGRAPTRSALIARARRLRRRRQFEPEPFRHSRDRPRRLVQGKPALVPPVMTPAGSTNRGPLRHGRWGGPRSYFTLGASAPRHFLREPYPRRKRRRISTQLGPPVPPPYPVAGGGTRGPLRKSELPGLIHYPYTLIHRQRIIQESRLRHRRIVALPPYPRRAGGPGNQGGRGLIHGGTPPSPPTGPFALGIDCGCCERGRDCAGCPNVPDQLTLTYTWRGRSGYPTIPGSTTLTYSTAINGWVGNFPSPGTTADFCAEGYFQAFVFCYSMVLNFGFREAATGGLSTFTGCAFGKDNADYWTCDPLLGRWNSTCVATCGNATGPPFNYPIWVLADLVLSQ